MNGALKLRAFNVGCGMAVALNDFHYFVVGSEPIRDVTSEIVAFRARSGEVYALDFNADLYIIGFVPDVTLGSDSLDAGSDIADEMTER